MAIIKTIIEQYRGTNTGLASLRDAWVLGWPVVALRLPPANGCEPSGFVKLARRRAIHCDPERRVGVQAIGAARACYTGQFVQENYPGGIESN